MKEMIDTVICGDVLDKLPEIPTGSVNCCVTSPPYWGLRDYGVEGQLGLEKTPEEYVAKMVEVFREVWRVLRDDGTLWLNMGDSYAGGGRGFGYGGKQDTNKGREGMPTSIVPPGLKPKDLCGIPWRVAFALQADGWFLRQHVIWHKPNPMPESATDRCTKAHDYIFLMTKSGNPLTWTNNKLGISTRVAPPGIRGAEGVDWEWVEHSACEGEGCDNKRCINGRVKTSLWQGHDYYYDAEAIKEDAKDEESYSGRKFRGPKAIIAAGGRPGRQQTIDNGCPADGKTFAKVNKRSVWTVPTCPYSEAHFATFPPDLILPCILAGCPQQVCKKCGEPRRRILNKTQTTDGRPQIGPRNGTPCADARGGNKCPDGYMTETTTTGWTDCGCGHGFDSGVVLDPFAGAFTTALVAYQNNRHYTIIELSEEYVKLGTARLDAERANYGLFES